METRAGRAEELRKLWGALTTVPQLLAQLGEASPSYKPSQPLPQPASIRYWQGLRLVLGGQVLQPDPSPLSPGTMRDQIAQADVRLATALRTRNGRPARATSIRGGGKEIEVYLPSPNFPRRVGDPLGDVPWKLAWAVFALDALQRGLSYGIRQDGGAVPLSDIVHEFHMDALGPNGGRPRGAMRALFGDFASVDPYAMAWESGVIPPDSFVDRSLARQVFRDWLKARADARERTRRELRP
jgi:hypothetical protein